MAHATAAHHPAQAGLAPLTTEQLAMAYRHLCRPGWPCTLEAALASRPYWVAITQVARSLNRGPWNPAAGHHLPRLPAPPLPVPKPSTRKRFDARKAAANDLDD